MSDEQAQQGPLWSDDRIDSYAWNAPTAWEAKRLGDAMRKVRDEYEQKIAALQPAQQGQGQGWDYEPEYGSDDWASRRGYELATMFGDRHEDRMEQADDIADELKRLRDHMQPQLAAPQPAPDAAPTATEPQQPVAAWEQAFPPDWDGHPWANYASLVASFGHMDGITFMWYYWEQEPTWGTKSYNWTGGKWGPSLFVRNAPLNTFFDMRATLRQRPTQQGGEGVGDDD